MGRLLPDDENPRDAADSLTECFQRGRVGDRLPERWVAVEDPTGGQILFLPGVVLQEADHCTALAQDILQECFGSLDVDAVGGRRHAVGTISSILMQLGQSPFESVILVHLVQRAVQMLSPSTTGLRPRKLIHDVVAGNDLQFVDTNRRFVWPDYWMRLSCSPLRFSNPTRERGALVRVGFEWRSIGQGAFVSYCTAADRAMLQAVRYSAVSRALGELSADGRGIIGPNPTIVFHRIRRTPSCLVSQQIAMDFTPGGESLRRFQMAFGNYKEYISAFPGSLGRAIQKFAYSA